MGEDLNKRGESQYFMLTSLIGGGGGGGKTFEMVSISQILLN